MEQSISFLLGAGFSVPAGYPTAQKLNNKLLYSASDPFVFNDEGGISISTTGKKPYLGPDNKYDRALKLCCNLMHYFKGIKSGFNYEEFYDFIINNLNVIRVYNESEYRKWIDSAHSNLNDSYSGDSNLEQALHTIRKIYPKLITYYLKDKNVNAWYEGSASVTEKLWLSYAGILDCFRNFGQSCIINIHTLNHDLFFESLNYYEDFKEQICDGFEESDSPYYGVFSMDGRMEERKLEYYKNIYEKRYRLFKLHGSIDYLHYCNSNSPSPAYVKRQKGTGVIDLYKEVFDNQSNRSLMPYYGNHHGDFLSGTLSKVERYNSPFFNELFNHFKNNLKHAEKLIVIGYGGWDEEINKIILDNFDHQNKPSFIINPYPNDNPDEGILKLKRDIGATLVESCLGKENCLEEIEIKDLS